MTPEQMAAIHAAAFTVDRPWGASEFRDMLGLAGVSAVTSNQGFALIRLISDEAELLTIAVHPDAQNRGEGHRLMTLWMQRAAERGAAQSFLEVAADNAPAIHLYRAHGFAGAGLRRQYYARGGGAAADAVLMTAPLTHGQQAESPS